MKKYLLYIGLIIFLLIGQTPLSYANNATDAYQKESLETTSFDKKEWKSSGSGMEYSKKPKAKKRKKHRANSSTGTGTISPPREFPVSDYTFQDFAQTLLVFLAVVILAFVILKVVAGDAVLVNKQVQRRKTITLEEIETNLEEADVEGFLKQALADQDYRLAIRLYYLAIIKELSAKGIIEWKKDKTNGHYMRELRKKKHPKLEDFKQVTRIFEYVWYSNMVFDGGQFEEVRTNFKNLLAAIK